MLSAVVLTKNEEENIVECLKSLDWCDEIIIIDDFSTDNTLAKLKSINNKKIKIFKRHLNDDFAAARNYALSIAEHEWVLFIDADERVSDSLQYEILSSINNTLNNTSGYLLNRKDYMWGKLLHFGESFNNNLMRLAKKNRGKWKGKVHEKWKINGKSIKLNNPIIHKPHNNIKNFLEEINYYTDLRAQELYQTGYKVSFATIIIYPLAKFFQVYIIRFGIIDGVRGLICAVMMSFHSFLVRGKLWKLWDLKRE